MSDATDMLKERDDYLGDDAASHIFGKRAEVSRGGKRELLNLPDLSRGSLDDTEALAQEQRQKIGSVTTERDMFQRKLLRCEEKTAARDVKLVNTEALAQQQRRQIEAFTAARDALRQELRRGEELRAEQDGRLADAAALAQRQTQQIEEITAELDALQVKLLLSAKETAVRDERLAEADASAKREKNLESMLQAEREIFAAAIEHYQATVAAFEERCRRTENWLLSAVLKQSRDRRPPALRKVAGSPVEAVKRGALEQISEVGDESIKSKKT